MYSQWMPQNLQKRLLLYILQQLSLFSEIDLPNLEEVSLNNIHLKDVLIDPEKVGKLRGCTIRYGKLRNVELTGGVVGGVNFDVDGVEIVAALNVDNLQSHQNNVSSLLAQSTADLASTILFEGKDTNLDNVPGIPDSLSDPNSSAKSEKKPSALGGVMSRAVEIALSRLQVNVKDITVKFVSDSADLVLHVDSFAFGSNNGSRSVSLRGIRLAVTKPDVNPGHHQNTPPESDSSKSDSEEENEDGAYVDASLMDSMVFTHEEASSIYMSATSHTSKPSTEELSSPRFVPPNDVTMAFIDHISLKFDGLNPISNLTIDINTVCIAAVPLFPTASSIFNSISKMLKLKNHSLRKQNRSGYRQPDSSPSESDDDMSDTQPPETPESESSRQLFNKVRVAEIVICLTSAITREGEIASNKDDINVVFQNLTLKQKNQALMYGGVEAVRVLRYVDGFETVVFKFDNNETQSKQEPDDMSPSPSSHSGRNRADIRFEMFRKATDQGYLSELTALLSKPATIDLDCDSVQYLKNFATYLQTVFENVTSMISGLTLMKELSSPKRTVDSSSKFSVKNSVLLQTSSINASVRLSESEIVKVVVLPISLNTLRDQLSAQRIIVSLVSDGVETPFFTIPSILLDTRSKEFKSFHLKKSNSIPHASILESSNTLSCGEIQGSVNFKLLQVFYHSVSSFMRKMNCAKDKVNALPAMPSDSFLSHSKPLLPSGLTTSVYSNQSRYGRFKGNSRDRFAFGEQKLASSFRFTIKKVNFVITDLSKTFGDVNVFLDHFDLSFQGDAVHGFISDLLVDRRSTKSKINQPFFRQLSKVTGSPIALFVHKTNDKGSSTDVTLRKFCLEYYTQWLQLIERDVTQGHNAEEIVHFAPIEDLQVSSRHSELRVTLIDFFVGLNPSRLQSKLCLGVSKGSMDFTMGKEQFYIKCSFREPSVNLIDDVKRLEPDSIDSQNSSVSPDEVITDLGYTTIGQLNALHVGITVNSDIEKIKSRNKRLGIRGDISLLDLKINIDDIQVGLCSDSTHTLLQTTNDLKTPVYFSSNEKARATVASDFSMPPDILSQIEAIQKNLDKSQFIYPLLSSQIPTKDSDTSSNFFIVDEYYNREGSLDSEVDSGLNDLSLESSNSNNGETHLPLVEDHYSQKTETNTVKVHPFSLHVNLSSIKIYLYDGYDWKYTRKTLRKAVKSLEEKAAELSRSRRRKSDSNCPVPELGESPKDAGEARGNKVSFAEHENFSIIEPIHREDTKEGPDSENENQDENEGYGESQEGEQDRHVSGTIFQSIHLTMSESGDPGEFVNMINSQVQFETHGGDEEVRSSMVNGNQINVDVKKYYKGLRLNRSKAHKCYIDLKNLEIIVTNFTSRDPRNDSTPENMEQEILNRIDVRIGTVTVFDNVPSSTWNKLLTYMGVLGEREIGTDMLKLSLTNVRPDPKLAFAEAIIQFSLLPIRLYVDQDTLGFLIRFFEFRDTRFVLPAEDPIYIQKLIVDPIKLKFDYKPKKVDYAGIKSGHHAEFANFFILDGSDIHLKKATFYGISGFSKLGDAFKNVYGPYIQKYQLANILSGLSPLRSLVNIGGGVKSLVAVPYKEYKKDKRMMRSLEKGTKSFAKTTTYELLKLGVKLASGTQVILENSEEYFGGEGMAARRPSEKASPKSKPKRNDSSRVNQASGLLQTSQILKKNTRVEKDTFSGLKLYSNASLDEAEEENSDLEAVEPSLLVIDSADEDDGDLMIMGSGELDMNDGDDKVEKMVSLYSNQPSNAKEGLISAYKSLGKNLKITKKSLKKLKDDLKDSDTIQDSLTTIAKSSPVIVIRPVIGTTEAVVKTLMGISNQVDSKHIKESQDKYRSEIAE